MTEGRPRWPGAALPWAPHVADLATDVALAVSQWFSESSPYLWAGTLLLAVAPLGAVRSAAAFGLLPGERRVLLPLESALEAAPQLLLQLYAVVALGERRAFALVSALVSAVSLGWALLVHLASDFRGWRLVLQSAARVSLLVARLSALLLFAKGFHAWVFALLVAHWIAVVAWDVRPKPDPSVRGPLFDCFVGAVRCFLPYDPFEQSSSRGPLTFHAVAVAEDIACVVLHSLSTIPRPTQDRAGMIISGLVVGGTAIGLFFWAVFYKWFRLAESAGRIGDDPKDEKEGAENSPASRGKLKTRDSTGSRICLRSEVKVAKNGVDESADVTGVEFHSVANSPEKIADTGKDSSQIRTGDTPKGRYPESAEFRAKELDLSSQKRRGICSSSQLEEQPERNSGIVTAAGLGFLSESSSEGDRRRRECFDDKASCDSIDVDLDLSFGDVNSSDINEFNENIVQKLCLSTLKNIKNVHQDADIRNIQRIALEILKELYSKGGVDDDRDLESELSSCVGRDSETPSEVLSTHDYENICAVNIAREAWGLRSWRACADMGASPPPPPLPARRAAPIGGPTGDRYGTAVPYESASLDGSQCGHLENSAYDQESDSTVFVAKPYVIDQNGGLFPLVTPLEPILEEIDELADGNSARKRQRRTSESALVATIDEIRHESSNNSPRNVYHRSDWDSPLPNFPESAGQKFDSRLPPRTSLRKSLWKGNLADDGKAPSNVNFKQDSSYNNCFGSAAYVKKNSDAVVLKSNKFKQPYVGHKEVNKNVLPNIDNRKLKYEINKLDKSDISKKSVTPDNKMPKNENVSSPKPKTLNSTREHNLSYEEVMFLSQLVTDSDLFLFKGNTNPSSVENVSNLGISSSLQSLIDRDNRTTLPSAKVYDGRNNIRRSGNKPRRKFSLLREKFETKSKHSDEEMLFQSFESVKSASQNNLNISSSRNSSNSSAAAGNQEPKVGGVNKENFTPGAKVDAVVSPPVEESLVLSLTPYDSRPINSCILSLKEKRNLFLKQVLSPPKINSWSKKT